MSRHCCATKQDILLQHRKMLSRSSPPSERHINNTNNNNIIYYHRAMLFKAKTVDNLLSYAANANYDPNKARTPSNHGGEIGGLLACKILKILNLRSDDTFGELGFGRGRFLIRVQLLHQDVTCFGVENDKTRFGLSSVWMEKILNRIAEKCIWRDANSTVCPHFIFGDFSGSVFWDEHGREFFRRQGLKLYFNNYNHHMLYASVQTLLENYLTVYCPAGTIVVSLAEMFLDKDSRPFWENAEVHHHEQNHGDVSWSDGGGIILIYVYRRTLHSINM